jgi:hypothetical protein
MKRLTNLREVARKKISSYLKMGIITTFPDKSKRYISINGNKVGIEKFFGGHLTNSHAPPMQYKVSATFDIYKLTDDGMVGESIGNTNISVYLPDCKDVDLYSRLYEELKLTLYNHADDAVIRVPAPPVEHNHEEEEKEEEPGV